jgi:exodeoxyribonuclease-5
MQWSPQQDAALKAVHDWLTTGSEQVFRIFGYAGTGKTTLAKHFAEGVEGLTLFGAFTGKAAHVLRQKGCVGASTIHSLIYHPKDKSQAHLRELELELSERRLSCRRDAVVPDEDSEVQRLQKLVEAERQNLARPAFTLNLKSAVSGAKLVIVDECSQVDGRMGQDLLSFGVKVLALGDPAQLPPIGDGGFFTDHEPDVMLTEIHRQAKESPIIQLATDAREKRLSSLGEYGSSLVLEEVPEGGALAAEQILVGRNKTRHASNRRMREMLGLGEGPVRGDKLVCLRNNHDLGLLNGSLWSVRDSGGIDSDYLYLDVESLDGMGTVPLELCAHKQPFEGRELVMPWWDRKMAEEFDYGYAMTVHKAQGSQWNDVLLFDESGCFRGDKWRWLYTGITRAAERITIVRT